MEQKRSTAALYVRCSTVEQETAGQVAALRQYADAYGWSARVFQDDAQSGHKAKRPALTALLDAVKAGQVQIVIAWRLDRLGRSIQNVVALVKGFEQAGARVITLEGYDTVSDCAPLMLGILSGWAESESRRISARCKINIEARKKRGERVGRIPKIEITSERLRETASLSVREAAAALSVTPSALYRARKQAAL